MTADQNGRHDPIPASGIRRRNRTRGFSLLELLLVLLIIGLMTGAMLMSVSLGEGDPARSAAQQLRAVISMAYNQAQAQGRNLAIGFWQRGWKFYELDGENHWQPALADKMLRPRTLARKLRLQLVVSGQQVVLSPLARAHPQVFLLSSGETEPFQLTVMYDGHPKQKLRGDSVGRLKLEPADAP